MCQPLILMIMKFIGFIIFLLANLPAIECAGNTNDDIALRRIFVGKLSSGTTDETLRKHFEQFGDVEEAMVIKDQRTQENKGYGFVRMKNQIDAKKACSFDNPIIDGQRVNVHLAAKYRKTNLPPRLRSQKENQSHQFQENLPPRLRLQNELPKFQEKIYKNSNSRIDGRKEKLHLASKANPHRENAPQIGKNDIALRKIFVCGLSFKKTTETTLRKYFEQFGAVEETVVIIDRQNRSSGYGFVTMKKSKDAEKACRNPNPSIDGRVVDVNLAAKPENNKHMSARLYSLNKLPKFQAQPYAPSTSHLSSSATPFEPNIQPAIPAAQSSLSHSATPYVPQTSHLRRFSTPALPNIQSGIPVVPLEPLPYAGTQHYTSQNLHWPSSAIPVVSHIQPSIPHMNLPSLASAEGNRRIQNNQNLSQEAGISSLPIDQPSLSENFSNGGQQLRTKVRISKPPIIESKPMPTVDRSAGSTSHNDSSPLNKVDLSEEHSVNSNDHRHQQENIRFGTIDMDKFMIENNGATKKSDSSSSFQQKGETDSEKNEVPNSMKESSSKLDVKKDSWADMVEEDETKKKDENTF